MALSLEMMALVKNTASAINELPAGYRGNCDSSAKQKKQELVRYLYQEISMARLKNVSWKTLAETIKQKTGVAMGQRALKKIYESIEREKTASREQTTETKEVKRYGIDYKL